MNLMQSLQKPISVCSKYVGLFAIPLFLFGCTATATQQTKTPPKTEQATEQKAAKDETAKEATKPTLPFSPDLMYYILTAEVAGQRGEVGAAVDLYYRASEMVESPALASRSAQVASLTRDQKRISRSLDRWVKVEPNNPDVYIMQAPFLMLKQDYDGVVDALNKGLALAPDNRRNYLVRISENLVEVASPEHAMRTIEQLDLFKQGDPAAHFAYARLAYFYKQNDLALAELEPLLKAEPDNEDYLILKADVLQRMGKSEEGLALIEDAAQDDDASEPLRFTYGKLLGDSGQTQKAKEVFEAMYAESPDNRDILYALGLLSLEDNDPEQAKSYFTDLLKVGDPSLQVAYFMGLSEEMSNNIDAALVWFASVPVHSSRFSMAQTHYINLLLQRGEVDKAREHLAGLRNDLPEHAKQYYLFEASMMRDLGNDRAAFDVLTNAVKEFPTDNDLLYSRAMMAESIDKLDILEQDLRTILEHDPDNAQALNALGYTLTDRTDRHQEALIMIKRALELKPDDPFYLDSLGWVYYRLGDLPKAEQYLRQAVDIQPDVEFVAHLGEVLWVRGKQAEAKQVWASVSQQDKDNALLLETMRRFGQ